MRSAVVTGGHDHIEKHVAPTQDASAMALCQEEDG